MATEEYLDDGYVYPWRKDIEKPDRSEFYTTTTSYRGWKAMQLLPPAGWERPRGLKNMLWWLWGWDIFLGPVPFFKGVVLANIIVWLLFA